MKTKIRQIREERGIKQVWLAQKAGISGGMLCQIEFENRCPSLAVALKLAGALDCKVEDLFESEEA